MGTINNIWGTADAWSRDFGYDDYLRLCIARDSMPVSQAAYLKFRDAFYQAMCDDPEMQPTPDLQDMHDGIAQALEMNKNMCLYGTIDKPAN